MKRSIPCLLLCACLLMGCLNDNRKDREKEMLSKALEDEIDRMRKETEEMDPVRIQEKQERDSLCRELCDRLDGYKVSTAAVDSALLAGADPNCDCTIQHSQKRFGARIPIVKDFMRRKYNTWETQKPVLTMAVSDGNLKAAQLLLDAGADPNRRVDSAGLALDEALAMGDRKMIDLLLDAGADPKLVDLGNTSSEEMVDRFVALGADPANIDFGSAIRDCDKRRVRKYFNLGARPKQVDHFFLINFCERDGVMETMLEMGMDPDVPGKMGKGTLLVEATKSGSERQMKLLLKAGADPDLPDLHSRCPLRIAIERSKVGKVNLLLEAGAEVNPRDEGIGYGKNLMETAISKGNVEVVRKMQAKGARVQSEHGSNLDYARKMGAEEAILMVLK